MLVIASVIFTPLISQEIPEKTVTSNIEEVTVFLKGAQIVREKSVQVDKGKHVLKFVNLSPFIDAKSIQVKADGQITVLGVNHQQNFLEKSEKSEELKSLENQLKSIEDQITEESARLSILQEELEFLRENRDLAEEIKTALLAKLLPDAPPKAEAEPASEQ